MKLSNKLEVAKNNGFSKGMIIFYIMRILSFIGILNVLNSFLETKKLDVYYGINVPGAYWFLVVLNASLFMVYFYGIWSVSRNGYYFVIAYIVSQPILNILQYAIYDEYFPYIEFSFQEVISKVLASIIVASLYFIYIRNRKFIFSIDHKDFVIDLDFYVQAYNHNYKSLKEISSTYMIDKKTLENNLDSMVEKYGNVIQYGKYFITFKPYIISTPSDEISKMTELPLNIAKKECSEISETVHVKHEEKSEVSSSHRIDKEKLFYPIFAALSILLILSVVFSIYQNEKIREIKIENNTNLNDLNNQIADLQAKYDSSVKDIEVLKAEKENLNNNIIKEKTKNSTYIKYIDYLSSYEDNLPDTSFYSWNQIIVADLYDTPRSYFTCKYYTSIYCETDNGNIEIYFDDNFIGDTIGYTIQTYKKGCSTIYFKNESNKSVDKVLVIVK